MFGTVAAPAIVGDILYATLGDERVTAMRVEDGATVWSVPGSGATQDLLATERRLYVPTYGMLTVYDRATGVSVATGRTRADGQTFTTAPAARGAQIFITSSEGAWSFQEPE